MNMGGPARLIDVSSDLISNLPAKIRRCDYRALHKIGKGELRIDNFTDISYSSLPIGNNTSSFGTVYKALKQSTGEIVALKKIKKELTNDTDDNSDSNVSETIRSRKEETCEVMADALRELFSLATLKHENIVRMIGFNLSGSICYLVFEYIPMDLTHYIYRYHNGEKLHSMVVQSIFYQLLQGITACHAKNIWHWDLKPSNCLVDPFGGVVKVADFGMARHPELASIYQPKVIVTLAYRPPEALLRSGDYSSAVDIWSAGCIFAELLTQKSLFHGYTVHTLLWSVFRILGVPTSQNWPEALSLPEFQANQGSFPRRFKSNLKNIVGSHLSSAALDLLESMLQLRPQDRPPAEEVSSHKFFRGFDRAKLPSLVRIATESQTAIGASTSNNLAYTV